MARSADDPGGVRPHSVPVHRRTKTSDRFLDELKDATRVTFVSHVHPDPDALGSMMGLAHLVETCLCKPTRITRDGPIGRAENRALVDTLHVELDSVEMLIWDPGEAVVMVDSQPKTGRHSFPRAIPITAVLDHHETPGDLTGVPFVDIRRNVGATCSIVAKYLMEQDIVPPKAVATALLYGIETETNGYPREASALDDEATIFLYPAADKNKLAKIRNARLPISHFETLLLALQSTFIYDRLIVSWASELPQPDLAAEVCDFLIRFEEVDWAVCAGVHGDNLILSARSALSDANAGELLRSVVGRMGRAGGHDRRAGGCVKLASTAPSAVEEVQAELRRRLLKALKIDECRGQRLVPLRELLQNLQG
ncbi:MAG: DHH family phosphoesterase [Gemmataceae bacterium]|nr:DHH family phosphoesterase [Gemmataceae bacterium]